MTIISTTQNTSKNFRNRHFLVVLVSPLAAANMPNLQINFSNLILFPGAATLFLGLLLFYLLSSSKLRLFINHIN